jgi:hypothetical protein
MIRQWLKPWGERSFPPDQCPCCREPMGEGHNPMHLEYTCPDCGHEWDDIWCSAVTSPCPECGANDIEPETCTDLDYVDEDQGQLP